jgi:hypothetical protein
MVAVLARENFTNGGKGSKEDGGMSLMLLGSDDQRLYLVRSKSINVPGRSRLTGDETAC